MQHAFFLYILLCELRSDAKSVGGSGTEFTEATVGVAGHIQWHISRG